MNNELFECRVHYEQTQDNGMVKKVTESYLVEAMSFTEAEARITEEMNAYLSGDFEVVSVVKRHYSEIIFTDDKLSCTWFKAKIFYIALDEKTGAEKKNSQLVLIQTKDFSGAVGVLNGFVATSLCDITISSLTEMPYMDYFSYEEPAKKEVKS